MHFLFFQVKAAFYRLSKELHPDRNPDGGEKFKKVSAAYDVIGNPERRKKYDAERGFGHTQHGPGFSSDEGNKQRYDRGRDEAAKRRKGFEDHKSDRWWDGNSFFELIFWIIYWIFN